MSAARTEFQHYSSVSSAHNPAGLGGNQRLMIDHQQGIGLDQLRL
jgi:hypothetical protein